LSKNLFKYVERYNYSVAIETCTTPWKSTVTYCHWALFITGELWLESLTTIIKVTKQPANRPPRAYSYKMLNLKLNINPPPPSWCTFCASWVLLKSNVYILTMIYSIFIAAAASEPEASEQGSRS
jgi:hypothetical protein